MKRGILGTRITGKTLAILVAIVLAVAALCALPMTAFAKAGDTPDHSKTLTDNEDGTYKLELSVTGEADTTVQKASDVNVIIVYDVSQSMTSAAAGSSGTRAANAERVLHGFIEDLAEYQDGDNIQVAVVTFGPRAQTRQTWTDNLTDSGVNRFFDNDESTSGHNYSSNLGTNWEAGLSEAQDLIAGLDEDRADDPTFVIFVTDGVCTAQGVPGPQQGAAPTDQNWTNYRQYYVPAANRARAIQSTDNVTLFGIYAYGTEHDLLDDLMYYSNTGEQKEMTVDGTTYSLTEVPSAQYSTFDFGETDPSVENYFNASDTSALESAIESIFKTVVEALGVSSVNITDGTTSNVETSAGMVDVVDVVDGSFQYWIEIPVVDNKFTRTDMVTGDTITYTVTDNGDGTCTVTGGKESPITVDGKVTDGKFKFEWTEATELSDGDTPPTATFDGSTVNWNLKSVGTLLNDVTYSVTFDVYPSQDTLDTLADIKNDPDNYAEIVDDNLKPYINEDGTFNTNTEAGLTWTDTRDGSSGDDTFDDPDPVTAPTVEEVAITKEWENELDGREAAPVTLSVLRDGTEHYTAELSADTTPKWTDTVFISIGIMRTDGDEVEILAPGHEFAFAEPQNLAYYWELDIPTVRPMMIDGEVTMLIKVDDKHQPDGADTYTIDGKEYYVGSTGEAALTATNERRSNLNLTKVVEGDNVPEGATFPFTLSVTDANDDDIWFSIQDAEGEAVTDATVSGATASGDSYTATSGAEVTVEMQADWNLRVFNLPTDSTFSFTEGDLDPAYKFDEAALSGADEELAEFKVEGQEASGKIAETNKSYLVTFTNEYAAIDVTAYKEWNDGSNRDGNRPTSLDLTLNGLPDGVTATPEISGTDGDKWTYTWKGVPKYDSDGEEIVYTITEEEESVPEGYDCETTTVDAGGTITNKYTPETTSVTVKKAWEGNTEESVQVQLYADGSASGDPVTLNEGNQWTYTWEGLYKNKNGDPIAYTVDEVKKPEGYDKVVSGDAKSGFTITNTYNPKSCEINLSAHKTLKNAKLEAGQFSFQLLDENGEVLQTKQNKADGSVVFDSITYDKSIFDEEATDEEPSDEGGQEKSTEDDENNAGGDSEDTTDETITTSADEATADDADQVVEGDAAAADEVEEATEADAVDEGAVDDAAADDAAADIAHETAVMAEGDEQVEGTAEAMAEPREKTFTYTIKEVAGDNKKITYDTHEVTVTVTVKDDGKGKITASADYTAEFVNTYKVPTPVIVDPPVQKVFEGPEDLCDELYYNGDFTLTIENTAAPDGVTAPMPANTSVTNSATYEKEGMTGYYEFGEIEFTKPGTYTYNVTESGSVKNVTNDPEASSGKSVTFTVTEDDEGNLSVSPTTDEVEISFTNTVKAEKKTPKKKKSKLPKAGDGAPIIPMIVLIIAAAAAFMVVRSRRLALDQRKQYRRPNRRGRR